MYRQGTTCSAHLLIRAGQSMLHWPIARPDRGFNSAQILRRAHGNNRVVRVTVDWEGGVEAYLADCRRYPAPAFNDSALYFRRIQFDEGLFLTGRGVDSRN